jgi:hypothetical protein
MIEVVRAVLASLAQPDDQGRDWYAWGASQLAHAAIGVALAGIGIMAGLPAYTAAALAALGYGLAKEVPDFFRAPGWRTARDCLRDALFVAGGTFVAAALAAGSPVEFGAALAAVITGLSLGVYQRAATGNREAR